MVGCGFLKVDMVKLRTDVPKVLIATTAAAATDNHSYLSFAV